MRRLLASSLRGRGPDLRALAGWSLLEALPVFLSGLLVARAIDDGFLAGRATRGLLWLTVLGLAVAVGAWATRQSLHRLAAVVEPFRDELVVISVTSSLRRSTAVGASPDTAGLARLSHHVELAREAYAGLLMVLQGFVVTTASALVGVAGLAPVTLALVLGPLVAGLAVFVAALPATVATQREAIRANEVMAEHAALVAAGRRDVTAAGGEEAACAIVAAPIDEQARVTRALARYAALRSLAVAVGGWLPVLLILAAGPWLLDRGTTTGALLGALTYVLAGVQPALQAAVRELGGSGLWLVVSLGRIVEGTDLVGSDLERTTLGQQRSPATTGEGPAQDGPRRSDVRLDGVTFRYGSGAEPVLADLDLVVPEGEHLAVLGPSGSGKSTLAGVLAGLLRPEAGDVVLGGVRLDSLDPAELGRWRVLVPQEAYVFAGTVRENLAYLRAELTDAELTDAELTDAAGRLGAGPLLERLGGYDAPVRAGSLSAGERQLLTLVRAYVSPAPLVVLDEATCHLDPAAEARAERVFAQRAGSLVVVAHRITSARRARRILLLDGSRATFGTHDELLGASGLYRELVSRWH